MTVAIPTINTPLSTEEQFRLFQEFLASQTTLVEQAPQITPTSPASRFSFSFSNTGMTSDTGTHGAATQTSHQTGVRMPTQPQIDFYYKLCLERNYTPLDITTMSYTDLDTAIKVVRAYYPPSPQQLQMIGDKLANLATLGVDVPMTPERYSALTGGRDGTASKLIGELIELEKANKQKQPPTERQLELLVNMYLCPDVPFENFDIARRIELEDGEWRRPTPDEFAQDIITKMKQHEASKFIDDSRAAFHKWKQTRIKIGQMNHIRELEKRQMKIGAPPTVEWATDLFMNQVMKPVVAVNRDKGYNPDSFNPIGEMELMMFSEEEASHYIDILLADSKNTSLVKHTIEYNQTFEELRHVKTETNRFEKEFEEIQNIAYSIESIQGFHDEELHEMITSLLVDNTDKDGVLYNAKARIKDSMLAVIDSGAITFEGMAELCKDSSVAIHCLIGRF